MTFDISSVLNDWDPLLKMLGALAAPGGLWFWIDKYRNRIHLKVRRAGFAKGDASNRGLTIDVENVGSSATSTGPTFTVVGLNSKRKKFKLQYHLTGEHAKLPPLEMVQLSGWHSDSESRTLIWAWYFVITVPLSRGRAVKVRVRNAQFQQLGFWRFHWERLLFRFLGRCKNVA